MKRFMFALVAAAAAFILGCQNPDVNNPVAGGNDNLAGTLSKPAPVPNPSLIEFDQMISYTNPGASEEAMHAVGTIIFRITKVPTVPIVDACLYDVEIQAKGEITRAYLDKPAPRPAPWMFEGTSTDRIRIAEGSKVVFVKTFAVQGASARTVVNLPFTVTANTLALRTMSLTKVKYYAVPAYSVAQ